MHLEKFQTFLDGMKPIEKKEENKKENNNTAAVARKSKGGMFYFKVFAGFGFTGFAGFLLYYLIRKKY